MIGVLDITQLNNVKIFTQPDEPTEAHIGDVWVDLDDTSSGVEVLYARKLHASSHAAGGSDAITPDMIGAVDKENAVVPYDLVVEAPGGWANLIVRGSTREGVLENSQDNAINIQNRIIGDSSTRAALELHDENFGLGDIFRLFTQKDGVTNSYPIYHKGNKPEGSYSGNGSATARYLGIYGYSGILSITSEVGMALVTNRGAICKAKDSTTIVGLPASQVNFSGGTLTIASTSEHINQSGQTYWYQAL